VRSWIEADGPLVDVSLRVNGIERELRVPPLRRLLDCLRDDLGLTGTKEGCGEGECGACTVLVDGAAILSCLVPVCQVARADVQTIESDALDTIQRAFLATGAAQCGICTPGMITMTRAFLDQCARDGTAVTEEATRTALAGNLCRCTGYEKIIDAVLRAREAERGP
jgi:aerobic-type carbon monoxide dehydrogenase small subunit (CoxS/CutS family)